MPITAVILTRGYLHTQGSVMRDNDKEETRGNLYVKSRYELNDYWVSI